jgi:hypothetical protein
MPSAELVTPALLGDLEKSHPWDFSRREAKIAISLENGGASESRASTLDFSRCPGVALRDRLLTNEVPSKVRDSLKEIHRLNAARNAGLKAQTIEAVEQLNTIGVEPFVLQGAAGLLARPFADSGSRVMVDINILVMASDSTSGSVVHYARDRLQSLGLGT